MKAPRLILCLLWSTATLSPATTAKGSVSCWERRQFAHGSSLNPNKFVAQSGAKSSYQRSVADYRRYCEQLSGCSLRAPAAPAYPYCIQTGPNWQCYVNEEIYCTRPETL